MTKSKVVQAIVPEVVVPEVIVLEAKNAISTLVFSYSEIEDEVSRQKLQDAAVKIKSAYLNAHLELVQVGRELNAVKDILKPGKWTAWLKTEFTMSERTAQRYIAVARRFSDLAPDRLSGLTNEAVYLLASDNTPEEVRAEALELVDKGEHLGRKTVLEMIGKANPQEQSKGAGRQYKAFYGVLQGEQVDSLVEDIKGRPEDERAKLVENLKRLLKAVEG
jgi:hypothetical protein